MAATPSTMLPLGTAAPDFTLPDTVSGKPVRLAEISRGKKATVVMFLCNHCPFVKHVRAQIAQLARDYAAKGVVFVGVSSINIQSRPADAPDLMTAEAREAGIARGLSKLFPHHGQNDCRLYDQLAHGAALPSVPVLLLPVLPPVALLAWFQGEALARWVALFDARGPPVSR